MADDSTFRHGLGELRDRMRKRVKRLPMREAAALVVCVARALEDGKLSGAEWDEIDERYQDLRRAIEGAEVVET